MKAFILAAGLGTRLRPLTEAMPKAMAPIAPGLPLLEHHVRRLRAQGIRDIVINLHHLAERITEHFGDGARFGVSIKYSDERDALLDTGGALRKAAPLLGENFLLVYGDQLHYYDFGGLRDLHARTGALVALASKRSDLPQNGDVAELDPKTGRVLRWHARPHAVTELRDNLYLNAGLYVLSPAIVDRIPAGRPVSLDREIIPALVAEGQGVYASPATADILDIGTPEKLAYAQRWFADQQKSRRRALFLDRDGVILQALPRGEYLTGWNQAVIMDGIVAAITAAKAAGYLVVVVTNQSPVSRGTLPEAALDDIHARMIDAVGRRIDAVYYCPHTDADRCECRKPRSGMLVRAGRDWNIDLDRSLMVGDSDRDVRAGAAVGCRTVFVRNDYNAAERAKCAPDAEIGKLSELTPLL